MSVRAHGQVEVKNFDSKTLLLTLGGWSRAASGPQRCITAVGGDNQSFI